MSEFKKKLNEEARKTAKDYEKQYQKDMDYGDDIVHISDEIKKEAIKKVEKVEDMKRELAEEARKMEL